MAEQYCKDFQEITLSGSTLNVQYPENLHNLHNDLLFLPERTKFKKVEKLVANLHDKVEYFIHIQHLK